jgi:hypothetical protein
LKGYIIDITSDINADINNNVPYKLSSESCQEAPSWSVCAEEEN